MRYLGLGDAMAMELITLDVRTRADWRRWLATHHASSDASASR